MWDRSVEGQARRSDERYLLLAASSTHIKSFDENQIKIKW
jgi:hypothetical protein